MTMLSKHDMLAVNESAQATVNAAKLQVRWAQMALKQGRTGSDSGCRPQACVRPRAGLARGAWDGVPQGMLACGGLWLAPLLLLSERPN